LRELRPNAFRGTWKEGYASPTFFNEGMEVWLPYRFPEPETIIDPPAGRKAVRCKVLVAAGDMARVINEKYGIDTWVDLLDVAIKEDDK
jgi:hypothetical protein